MDKNQFAQSFKQTIGRFLNILDRITQILDNQATNYKNAGTGNYHETDHKRAFCRYRHD